ncbi:hypothetical protein ACS0TY_006175 [Phlomoides rotata]
MHTILFVKPDSIPNDSTNPRWKWFKGYLWAIDDTYINVLVPEMDKGRYITRKWYNFNQRMDMSSHQSNGFGTGVGASKKVSGSTQSVWTQHEEKVLLSALKDLVMKG